MKKRICVYLLIFFAFLSHFLIPDTVFGSAKAVNTEYGDLLKKTEIHQPFINLLSDFKESELVLNSSVMKHFVNTPRAILGELVFPDTDPIILGYLSGNDRFRELFRDPVFHAVVRIPNEIDKLIEIMGDPPPICPFSSSPPEPEPPRATTLSIVSGNHQSGETGESLAQPLVVGVLDQYGKLLQGTTVTFTVTPGGRWLSATTQKTGVDGRAQTRLTLGSDPGTYLVKASVAAKDSLNSVQLTQTFIATLKEQEQEPPPLEEPPMYWIAGNTIYHRLLLVAETNPFTRHSLELY